MTDLIVSGKTCLICEEAKPFAEFPARKKSADGLSYQCKRCVGDPNRTRKYCPRCNEAKPIDEFGKHKRSTDGHNHYCKPCSVQMSTANYWTYHDRTLAYASEYNQRPEVKERNNQRVQRYRSTENGRRTVLKTELRLRFGLSISEYDAMLAEQEGVCAICKGTCTKNKRLSVDHDHLTGKVRGLVCNECNVGLARFKDSAENLRRAAEYLQQ